MSANRKHTDVLELGWLDFLAACEADPHVRVEGHDTIATQAKGRLVRFNRAVSVRVETATSGKTPRVHADGLRRAGENGDILVPGGPTFTITWDELDWVSWNPTQSADGRRFKITHTGRSNFGTIDLWEGNRLVDRTSGLILGEYANRGLAVAAAIRIINKKIARSA